MYTHFDVCYIESILIGFKIIAFKLILLKMNGGG